jgi:hypothetical protein
MQRRRERKELVKLVESSLLNNQSALQQRQRGLDEDYSSVADEG